MPCKEKDKPRRPSTRRACSKRWPRGPGATKRDLSRLLNIKGSDRIALEAYPEGAGSRRLAGRQPQAPLPSSPVRCPRSPCWKSPARIWTANCSARPQHWESNEEPPADHCRPGRSGRGRLGAANAFSRAFPETHDGYEARVIKPLGASAHRVLGVVRMRDRACASRPSTARAHRILTSIRATARRPERRAGAGRSAGRARLGLPARAWSSASAAWTRRRPSA